MKRIFLGSSSESKKHAETVAAFLSSIDNIEVVPWWEHFMLGEITLEGIERLANGLAGAVMLATPDDSLGVRGRYVSTPRANVLFEYGFLTAALGRHRVALCAYQATELPSDFNGLTYADMGTFRPAARLNDRAKDVLKKWAINLPQADSLLRLHPFSGHWQLQSNHSLWRGLQINPPDLCSGEYDVVLSIFGDGSDGCGSALGTFKVNTKGCAAEFATGAKLTYVRISSSGGLRFRSKQSCRQLVEIKGTPPQSEGFGQEAGIGTIGEHSLEPDPENAGALKGTYLVQLPGQRVISASEVKMWR